MDRDFKCVLKAVESAAKSGVGKVENVLRFSRSPTRSLISSINCDVYKYADVRR